MRGTFHGGPRAGQRTTSGLELWWCASLACYVTIPD